MGSSGGGGNPMFLSQGGSPMPGLPIAGQGAPNDDPRNFGAFQNFLPDIPAAGAGPAPSATGLTSEMFKYRTPQGAVVPAGAPAAAAPAAAGAGGDLRQQLAAVAAEGGGEFGGATNTWGGGAGDFGGWSSAGGSGQFGAGGRGGGYFGAANPGAPSSMNTPQNTIGLNNPGANFSGAGTGPGGGFPGSGWPYNLPGWGRTVGG